MKKISLLLEIVLLLQSCFSHKKVAADPKTMAIGQVYKIKYSNKKCKVVYTQNADSAIVVLKNGIETRIELKNIEQVREKKFSLIKTLFIPLGIVIAIIELFVLNCKGPSVIGIGSY